MSCCRYLTEAGEATSDADELVLRQRVGTRRAPIVIALLVLMNALFLRTVDPVFFSRMRDFAFDSFQRMQPRHYSADTPVRIVDIDESALAA